MIRGGHQPEGGNTPPLPTTGSGVKPPDTNRGFMFTANERWLERVASYSHRRLLDEYQRISDGKAGLSPDGVDNHERQLRVIQAIGDLKFPGVWNEWDSVKAESL